VYFRLTFRYDSLKRRYKCTKVCGQHLNVCKFKNEIVLVQNVRAYNVNGYTASIIFNLYLEESRKRAILRICINIQNVILLYVFIVKDRS